MISFVVMDNSTGYGPAARLCFNGDERTYEVWEMKFMAYMRTKELRNAIDPDAAGIVSVNSRERAFAELVQVLDDRSLNLIMRDAKDDGKAAMAILRDHYAGTSEQRILSLLTTLTTIAKGHNELLTDYVIRAESAANALRNAGEIVSDRLLNAVVLKGLPHEYRPFRVIMEQMKKTTSFLEFKKALRSFEENEKAAIGNLSSQMDAVMKISDPVREHDNFREERHNTRRNFGENSNAGYSKNILCYNCGGRGHKSEVCPSQSTLVTERHTGKGRNEKWCDYCKTSAHSYESCRNKGMTGNDSAKAVRSETSTAEAESPDNFHSFQFSVREGERLHDPNPGELLVDSGANKHILNDQTKFISFDRDYLPENHYVELANGMKINDLCQGRGTARVDIRDTNGKLRSAVLSNVLYVPTFPFNIFSVKSATKNGAVFTFGRETGMMRSSNGTNFPISSRNDLYFLNLKNNYEFLQTRSDVCTYYARFDSIEHSISTVPTVSSSIRFSTRFFATTRLASFNKC